MESRCYKGGIPESRIREIVSPHEGFTPPTHKQCIACKEWLEYSEFANKRRSRDRKKYICKSCDNARRKERQIKADKLKRVK